MADEILLVLNNQQKPLVNHYLETVAHGGLRKYRAATQTGIREGHDLYSHFIRGGLLAYSLGTLFRLPEEEIRLLVAAFSIHDLNKLYEPGGKSLRKLADDRAFFEQVIHDSGVADFLSGWRENFTDLKQLVLGHGGHTTVAGERLLARIKGSRLSKDRLDELTHLMRAVDISDIDEPFEERKFKDKFLLEINSVGAKQYRLISHRLGEHRGVLSNLIHNHAMEVLQNDYGATPIFLYSEGTWYLSPVDVPLPDRADFLEKVSQAVRLSLQAVRNQDLSKIVVLTKDGVKTDASLFGLRLSSGDILGEISKQVFRRKFASKDIDANRAKCDERLQRKVPKDLSSYCSEHHLRYPETEDSMRMGELLRALYNLVNIHFVQEAASLADGVTDAWDAIYKLLSIEGQTFEPFDKLYDRPFILAGTLGKSYQDLEQQVEDIFSRLLDARGNAPATAVADFLPAYLAEVLDVDFAPRPASDLAAYFRSYVAQNHRQCCYSAFSGQAESWMSAEVPKGIVVQQFSNRLEGGVKREPKRNICPVCREQFFLEQMLFRSGGAKGMYLHFFPKSSVPAEYLDTLRHTLENLAQKAEPDTFFLPTETSLVAEEDTGLELKLLVQKARGFALPRRSEAIGNTITLSVCPSVDVTGDGERLLSCVEIGLRMSKLLGLRCLVSEAPIPPLGAQQFGDFYIDTLPSALQNFFGNRDLRQDQADQLLNRYVALRIVDREVRTGYDSVAWDLARALGVTPLEIFAVADRALERKLRQVASGRDGPLGMTIRARISRLLENLLKGGLAMADGPALSARIKKMAEIATHYKLWGKSRRNRSSLLDPLETTFDNLRRMSPTEMDLPFIRAQSIEDIFAHIDRVRRQANPKFKIGKTKRGGITEYVDEFFRLLTEVYRERVPRILSHEKAIKAAYLCFLSETMSASNLEPVEEEIEEPEAENEQRVQEAL
jgi:CRISPR-associated protein Csc3